MTPADEAKRSKLSAALENAIRGGQLGTAYGVIKGLSRSLANDVMLFAGLRVHQCKGREFWTLAQAEIEKACRRRDPRSPANPGEGETL